MIEIIDAPLSRCNKEQHSWYMSAIDQLLKNQSAVKTDLGDLYQPFNDALEAEKVAVQNESGSMITGKMDKKKDELDDLISGLTHQIKNGLHHFDSGKREAAEYLNHIVKKYGYITQKSNKEKTADVRSMCAELLSADAAPYVAILPDAPEFIARIQTANEEHDTLLLQRTAETSSSEQITSLQAREVIDPLYKAIVRRINSLADINGSGKYIAVIDSANGLIADLKKTMEAEATTRRKQNEKKA